MKAYYIGQENLPSKLCLLVRCWPELFGGHSSNRVVVSKERTYIEFKERNPIVLSFEKTMAD